MGAGAGYCIQCICMPYIPVALAWSYRTAGYTSKRGPDPCLSMTLISGLVE
jgi:hypothetical protein